VHSYQLFSSAKHEYLAQRIETHYKQLLVVFAAGS